MNRLYLFALLFPLFFLTCGEDEDPIVPMPEPEPEPMEELFELAELTGTVQKGPFLNGSQLTLSELDSNLNLTGRTFSGNIASNLGTFRFGSLALATSKVGMAVNGFYFNEVSGTNSVAQLNLNTVVDLNNFLNVNVNLLGHLGWRRAQFLLEDMDFADAQNQAQQELLDMLEFTPPRPVSDFDQLDISDNSEGGAILLAASVIFQGRRSVSELSQLIANVGEDIREDGRLDDKRLGRALITGVTNLDLAVIRENVEEFYADLGLNLTIPPFEKYVRQFIENTEFEPIPVFSYPATGEYGINLLADTTTTDTIEFATSSTYSLSAIAPVNNELRIRMVLDPFSQGRFGYALGSDRGWEVGLFNQETRSQWFTVTDFDTPTDLRVSLMGSGWATIEYYENTSQTPTRIQSIIWGNPVSQDELRIILPAEGDFGPNLLALAKDGPADVTPGRYSLALDFQTNRSSSATVRIVSFAGSGFSVDEESAQCWDYTAGVWPNDTIRHTFSNEIFMNCMFSLDIGVELANPGDSILIELFEDDASVLDDSFESIIRW